MFFTIPTLMTWTRIVAIPFIVGVFYTELPVESRNFLATTMFVIFAITDWLDGYLARKLNQVSRLGVLLDPMVDRLYIAATLIGLALADLIPWWLVVLIALRDIALLALIPSLRKMGISALPVTYIGKAATFALLWGFPLILLGGLDSTIATVMAAAGWAFALWGTSLYWWSGVRYFVQAHTLLEDFNRKG